MTPRARMAAVFAAAVLPAFAGEVSLTFLESTDVHGARAFEREVALVQRERAANPELIAVDCGDLVRGSFPAWLDGGAAMVGLLNYAKYDISVPGNHEFRVGTTLLKRNIDLFTSGATLAANLRFTDPAATPGRPVLPWTMLRRKGLGIAIIGLVPPPIDTWFNMNAYKGVEIPRTDEVLEKAMAEIRAAKADVVVLAAHLDADSYTSAGTNYWMRFLPVLTNYPDISLMLAGHTHKVVPAKKVAETTWMVQPPIHAKGLAKVVLRYDTSAKRVTSVTSEFLDPKSAEPPADLPAEWAALHKRAEAAMTNVVARLPEGLVLERYTEKNGNDKLARLIAQAMAEATDADMAIAHNFGSWRAKGRDITLFHVYQLFANEYSISTLEVTPGQLRAILKEQGDVSHRSYGIDPARLPEKAVTIAFDAYDITGCDGALPVLRVMASSGEARRVDSATNLRQAFLALLARLYPAK